MSNQQVRISSVDMAAGILILWIMSFHAMNGSKVFGEVDARVALPFLTFSMPWFFYRSGQFFEVLSPRERLAKDTRKLLIPFILWTAIGYLVHLTMQAIDGTFTWQNCVVEPLRTFSIYGYIPSNVPVWFVLTLFFVRIFSNALLRWSVPPLVSAVVGIAIGFLAHLLNNPSIPFYVPNIAMGIAFFMLGRSLGRFEQNRYVCAACMAGYIVFLLLGCSIVGHHRNILLTGHYLLWPVFAYCGIVSFNNLCRWLDAFLNRRRIGVRPFTYLGARTMTLLVAHALVYMPVLHYSTLAPWPTVGVIFLGYVLFLGPLLWLKKS